jgi:hypothetical protein
MQTLSSVRRSLVNLCAFLLVLAFMAAFMGLGTRQVNHSRQKLHRTVAQLQAQEVAR